ncbi:pyruvate kinase [Candidatus Peregrinibacteria bacterium]|nr:pyruvate kinase [Candidatus Peregrinibacteria bacterium]
MRLTKIVCTLGPSTDHALIMKHLINTGVDIVRINLSHGTRKEHDHRIALVRKIAAKNPIPPAVLFDTRGAAIRTGDVRDPLDIHKGQMVIFSSAPTPRKNNLPCIYVNYDGFAKDVATTKKILLDNGELSFDIVRIEKNKDVVGRAREDGVIGSRRHINLPGADVHLPSLTQKDWDDIVFAIEQDIDYVALSFIRTADDIEEVRRFIQKKKGSLSIIAKIETAQAVQNINEIIRAADGVMVARGDLGAEIPYERIPAVQDAIVSLCGDAGKPVIVATHMLESMREHPIPTRAEITDVAHAAVTQADATMLSGETANGKFPLRAVEAMANILEETERNLARFAHSGIQGVHDEREARAEAAASMSESLGLPIVVFTRSGRTAEALSKFRPSTPIIALTDTPRVQRKLCLFFGIYPLLLPFKKDPESTLQNAWTIIKKAKLLHKGDRCILVSDVRSKDGGISTVQVRAIP